MKLPRKTLLATSLLALPALASALGLGGITVKSGLNQPLDAEIAVSVNSPAERDSLSVQLANPDDWSRVGVDLNRVPPGLKFGVTKNARGETVINVTSEDIIREPYLQLLIEVNWAKGRLLREYSLLLDPPVMASALGSSSATSSPAREDVALPAVTETMPASQPKVDPAPVVTESAAPAPVEAAEPKPLMVDRTPEPQAPEASEGGSYGPTKAGDTLWMIANANRGGASASLDRVMVAILQMNPNAFANGNINSLKKGQILRLPSATDLDKVSAADASRLIREQTQLWRDYQARSAQSATQVADPGQSATLQPTASTANTSARLEIVPPKSDTGASQALSTAKADAARLSEEVKSREEEARELRARVGQLESLQGDQKRMIELKDSEISRLQAELAKIQNQPLPPGVAPVEAPVATTTPSVPEATDTSQSVSNADPTADAPATKDDIWGVADSAEPSTGTETESNADPVTSTDASDPAMVDSAPPSDGTTVTPIADEPAPVSEPVIDEVTPGEPTDAVVEAKPWYLNPFVLGGAGLGLAGLLGFALTRKKSPPPMQSGPSIADGDINFGIPGGAAIGAIDFAGDEDEARIRAAISANPQDLWAHLDLLRLYFSRRDAANFESAASTMYGYVVDADSAQWTEARTMGEQLIPHSALFQAAPDFGSMDSNSSAFDLDAGFAPTLVQAPIAPPATPARTIDEPIGSLDVGAFDETPSKAAADASAFNFDLDLDSPIPTPITAQQPNVDTSKDDFNFDFSFDNAPVTTPAKVDVNSNFIPADKLGDINVNDVMPAPLELGSGEISADDLMIGEDSVSTKLDLARAYLDMGDPDGARSMLEEVLSEGSDAQRNEAKDLLGRIA